MRKNPTKSIIFVQSDEEVDWAIRYFHNHQTPNFAQYILGITDEAQVALFKRKLQFDHYLKLLPSASLKKKYMHTAKRFADQWCKNQEIRKYLTNDQIDIGQYLIQHWVNFLPLVLASRYTIEAAIKIYQPHEIIYFEHGRSLKSGFLTTSPEALLLDLCYNPRQYKQIVYTKITLPYHRTFSLPDIVSGENIKRYIDLIIEDPNNIFLLSETILANIRGKNNILKKCDVLLFGDRHLAPAFIPLLQVLKKRNTKYLLVGAYVQLHHQIPFIKTGLTYFDYSNIQPENFDQKITRNAALFWKYYKNSHSYHLILKSFDLEFFAEIISKKLEVFFGRTLHEILIEYQRSCTLLKKTRPKTILLTGNYGKKNLSLCFAAMQFNTKIIILQHGIMPLPKTIYTKIFDEMLVWGKIEKEIHTKIFELPKSKVKIAGWYYVDPLVDKIRKFKSAKTKITKRKSVLFVTNLDIFNNGLQIKTIKETIRSLSSSKDPINFIIRPHPGHTVSRQLKMLTPLGKNISIEWDFGKNLDMQLINADIIISQATTVALRAMLWKKPVIHLVPFNTLDICQFSKYGAAIKVNDMKDLLPSIEKIYSDEIFRNRMLAGQEKLLFEYAYLLDGKACERVANALQNSIQ